MSSAQLGQLVYNQQQQAGQPGQKIPQIVQQRLGQPGAAVQVVQSGGGQQTVQVLQQLNTSGQVVQQVSQHDLDQDHHLTVSLSGGAGAPGSDHPASAAASVGGSAGARSGHDICRSTGPGSVSISWSHSSTTHGSNSSR